MIRHLVLIRPRPDLDPREMEAVLAGLAALEARIPGMRGFTGGRDVSPEGLQRGYGWAFTIDFEDAAARDRYLADAGHQALGRKLQAAAEGGRDGICVLDLAG